MAGGTIGLMYGPLLIGAFLNCILYGVTLVQTYIYFRKYKSDNWRTRIFVLYLLICETLNTVFNVGVVFEPLIIRYGTSRVLTNAPIMLSTNPLLTVMISLPVQLFIAWRVKVMSNSIVLPATITFLAIAAFAGGIATTVAIIRINFEYSRFHDDDEPVIIWLASSAAADIIITASLVYSLLGKRTGFSGTDDIINKIIRLTIQTGFITAVSATLDVTLFLLLRGQTWNFIFDLPLSKLYSNTILSTLNARAGQMATSTVRNNVLFPHGTSGDSMSRDHAQIEIAVTTEIQSRRPGSPVPMKVFESGTGDVQDDSPSATNTEFGEV